MSDALELALDPVCAGAEGLAREVAQAIAEMPEHVGDHRGCTAEAEGTVVHRFTCLHPGYVGWAWAVAVSRAPGQDEPTVDEAWCEPGEGALLTPEWQPWSERVQPGDLGVGDVYPTAKDDPRLTAGFTAADDLDGVVSDQPLHPLQWELGLGRERVLSAVGVEDAADRWNSGDSGPQSALARAATERCVTCGWLMPLGGGLGQAFGVCAQPMSPSDGRVVALLHGCGAHSEVVAEPSPTEVVEVILDEVGFDPMASVADLEPEVTAEVVEAEAEAEVEAEPEMAEAEPEVAEVEVAETDVSEADATETAEPTDAEPTDTEPTDTEPTDEEA